MRTVLFLAILLTIPSLHPLAAQEADPPAADAAEDVATPPKQLSDRTLDELFESLAEAEAREADRIETEIVERWSKSGSDSIDLLLLRGRKAMEKRDFKKAIGHFSRAIAFQPDFAEGWNGRATAYFAEKQFGRSLSDLYEVLRIEPRHFGALIGLGLIFETLDEDKHAHEAYQAALNLHPNVEGAKEGLERLRKSVSGEQI